MKYTLINGSPNSEGTCSLLLAKISNRLRDKNELTTYTLNTMKIHGCQECFACVKQQKNICYFLDDIPQILEEIKKTKNLILASPVFFNDVSAQLKCVIDRTWAFFGKNGKVDHLPKGRKLFFILSYDQENDEKIKDIYDRYGKLFKEFGFDNIELIQAYGKYDGLNNPHISDSIENRLDELFPIIKYHDKDDKIDLDLLENR